MKAAPIYADLSAYAPLRLRIGLRDAKYATLRLNTFGRIRDGRVYKTERAMVANRSKRQESARMYAVKPSTNGYYELTPVPDKA